jgi:hypothetical protein
VASVLRVRVWERTAARSRYTNAVDESACVKSTYFSTYIFTIVMVYQEVKLNFDCRFHLVTRESLVRFHFSLCYVGDQSWRDLRVKLDTVSGL